MQYKVHKKLGPGFLEKIYENALAIELIKNHFNIKRQYDIEIVNNGSVIGKHRIDLLINDVIFVELKAVKNIKNIHFAVVKSYLKALNLYHGLIFNFNKEILEIKRVISYKY